MKSLRSKPLKRQTRRGAAINHFIEWWFIRNEDRASRVGIYIVVALLIGYWMAIQ